jgi:hypothetical protein
MRLAGLLAPSAAPSPEGGKGIAPEGGKSRGVQNAVAPNQPS